MDRVATKFKAEEDIEGLYPSNLTQFEVEEETRDRIDDYHNVEGEFEPSVDTDFIKKGANKNAVIKSSNGYAVLEHRKEEGNGSSANKQNECDQCLYTTKDSYNLSRHMKAKHSNVRDWGCEQCDYASSRKDKLANHINMKHRN